jgi:serine/threonine protein kinase
MKTPVLIEQITSDLNPVEKTLLHETTNIDDEEIRLINEGAYGCIYYPGLNCSGKVENKRYLTKIQKQTETTKNEWHISSRIQQIPSFRNYFSPIVKQCNVKVAKKYVRNIKKCQVFRNDPVDTIESAEFVSNKILFLGKETLNTYFDGVVSGKYASVSSMSLFFWKKIIETHTRLLRGIQLLLSSNIIHMDIKSGNVMIEPTQKHPMIIDFGISIDLKSFTPEKSFYIYDTYTPWCLDILLCNYVVKQIGMTNAKDTKVTEKEIDDIIQLFQHGSSKNKTRNDMFTTVLVSPNTLDTFRENTKSYLMDTFIHPQRTWDDVYTHMTQTTYTTWDSYGVSAMFLTLLNQLKQSKPELFFHIETAERGSIMKKYVKLLENTVFALPEKRPDIKTTLQQLEEMHKL